MKIVKITSFPGYVKQICSESAAVYAEKFGKRIEIESKADPFADKKAGNFQPPHSSARVAAQVCFQSTPDPRNVHDSDNLVRLELSAELVSKLKAKLRRCGIHPTTIFPDLDGLAA